MSEELDKLNIEQAEIKEQIKKLDEPKEIKKIDEPKEVPEVEKPEIKKPVEVERTDYEPSKITGAEITKLRVNIKNYLTQKKDPTFKIILNDDTIDIVESLSKCIDILKYLILSTDSNDIRKKLDYIYEKVDNEKYKELINYLEDYKKAVYGKAMILRKMRDKMGDEKTEIKSFVTFIYSVFPTEVRYLPLDYAVGASEGI